MYDRMTIYFRCRNIIIRRNIFKLTLLVLVVSEASFIIVIAERIRGRVAIFQL